MMLNNSISSDDPHCNISMRRIVAKRLNPIRWYHFGHSQLSTYLLHIFDQIDKKLVFLIGYYFTLSFLY